jgi:hypothetical protein
MFHDYFIYMLYTQATMLYAQEPQGDELLASLKALYPSDLSNTPLNISSYVDFIHMYDLGRLFGRGNNMHTDT